MLEIEITKSSTGKAGFIQISISRDVYEIESLNIEKKDNYCRRSF